MVQEGVETYLIWGLGIPFRPGYRWRRIMKLLADSCAPGETGQTQLYSAANVQLPSGALGAVKLCSVTDLPVWAATR